MDRPFTQRDVGYTIISRLEESIRIFLSDKLLTIYGDDFLEGIPDGIARKIIDKTSDDSWSDPIDFLEETDFSNLGEIITYKPNYKAHFKEIISDKENFRKLVAELYHLRCKIAHVRGYFTSTDLDLLIINSRKLFVFLNDLKKGIYSGGSARPVTN